MTTLNVLRSCGHMAPSHEETDPEKARQYVELVRNSHCDACPDVLAQGVRVVVSYETRHIGVGPNATTERREKRETVKQVGPIKVQLGFKPTAEEYRSPSMPAVEYWARNDGRLQVLQIVDPTRERRILESQGFERVKGSIRPTIKTALADCIPGDTLVPHLEAADIWIADNVTADHTFHTCPDCTEVMGECTDLACREKVSTYRCSVCNTRRTEEERATRHERKHTLHICSECGDMVAGWNDCYDTLDAYTHTTPSRRCNACGRQAARWPVSIMADRPLAHCEVEGCGIIVSHGVTRCRYHVQRDVVEQAEGVVDDRAADLEFVEDHPEYGPAVAAATELRYQLTPSRVDHDAAPIARTEKPRYRWTADGELVPA